jgi:hypothetical protein
MTHDGPISDRLRAQASRFLNVVPMKDGQRNVLPYPPSVSAPQSHNCKRSSGVRLKRNVAGSTPDFRVCRSPVALRKRGEEEAQPIHDAESSTTATAAAKGNSLVLVGCPTMTAANITPATDHREARATPRPLCRRRAHRRLGSVQRGLGWLIVYSPINLTGDWAPRSS